LRLALLCVLLSVPAALRADPPDDPLMKLNDSFRKQYAAGRLDVLVRSGPVIVVEGDKLVLLRGKERFVGDVILTQYHRLKAIAHVPLAVYLGQQLWQQADLSQQLKDFAWWKALDEALEATLASLDKYGFSAAQKERQRKILQESKEFHWRGDVKT